MEKSEEQVCPFCGFRCNNFGELREHIETFHRAELEKTRIDDIDLTEEVLEKLQRQAEIDKAQQIRENYPIAPKWRGVIDLTRTPEEKKKQKSQTKISGSRLSHWFAKWKADRDYRKRGFSSSPVYNTSSTPRRPNSRFTQKYYDFKRWFFKRRHPYSRLRVGYLVLNLGLVIGLILALFIVLSYFEFLSGLGFWFTGLVTVIALVLLYFIAKYFYKALINLKYGIRGLTNGAKLVLIIFFILALWQVYQMHPDLNQSDSDIDITTFFNITPIQEAVSNFTENINERTFIPFEPARETFNESPRVQSYPLCLNGRKSSLTFTTYGGLADYLAEEDHSYYHDYEQEVIMELLRNDYQDEYFEQFLEEVRRLSKSHGSQAKTAISLVQHIPYNWDGLYTISADFLYPYETLYRNRGVCCDKSILLAYLLDQLGYDVVLFEWESQHMAVGIRCNEKFDFQNTGYAFIETTRPTIITYVPDDYIGGFRITSSPNIIHVSKGGKELDVNNEYSDAQELKKIEAMGPVLDQYHYSRWLEISNKYNLQYDT